VAQIKIEGVPPWDGLYPIDLEYFTNRELHVIKEISNVRAGELGDEFSRGNNDLIVAVASVAATRNGKDIPIDDLWDAPVGKITLEDEPVVEADAGPPASPTPIVPQDGGVVSVLPDRSGSSSSESSDDQPATPRASTGSLG
jgi:hypothetical protein